MRTYTSRSKMRAKAYTRRDLLKTIGVGAFAVSVPRVLRAEPKAGRPNVLFCISDDQSWPHAGAYGSKMVNTPAFDRVAREGILFNQAFVSCPSCCPSRGSILTGQAFYRLREGSQNYGGPLRESYRLYTDLLKDQGYQVGYTGKGCEPCNMRGQISVAPPPIPGSGPPRTDPPCGKPYLSRKTTPPTKCISDMDYAGNFEAFLHERPEGQPFCFWYGAYEPHRKYEEGSGVRSGKQLADAEVPGFLPDATPVREDLLDYALEIEWFDRHLDRMIRKLEESGDLDNTLIIVTGDNGMSFPRAKTTLYDSGIRVPLAIRWRERVKPGRVVDDLVSFTDLAPTLLETVGIKPLPEMTGKSFLSVLLSEQSGITDPSRDHIIVGRERHHTKSSAFPTRAIRTHDYLYIRNYQPGGSWAGKDTLDIDDGITKRLMLEPENRTKYAPLYEMAFGPRPAEELYDVKEDPYQLRNLFDKPEHAEVRKQLSDRLHKELVETEDPRVLGHGDIFDAYLAYADEKP